MITGPPRPIANRGLALGGSLALMLLAILALAGAAPAPPEEWRSYGRDPGGARYSPLARIDRSNVSRLARAWTYHTGENAGEARPGRRIPPFECTPLVVDGGLYLSTPTSRVIALDAETGAERWRFDPRAAAPASPAREGQAHRGVTWWAGEGGERRIFSGTGDGQLWALDAATGRPCPGFGRGGAIDLREGAGPADPRASYSVTSPPAVYRDLVITGAAVPEGPGRGPSGDVRAFDARTGAERWRFHTVPQPGEPGHETWEGDSWRERTGVNVWSIMSVDVERGLVFLPIGSPAYDFYGGDRKGQNLYGNCLVALDAATGRRRWHYQLVHHDIWDYDPPAQPVLVTLQQEGRQVPAVVQLTKMGLAWVFDRETGRPVFGAEERPVPASQVPGEATWPTQPFPLKPPPLSRQGPITAADLSSVTPEASAAAKSLFAPLASGGIFTPPGLELTLWWPGTLGGCTWSGGSFDPTRGFLYVNVNEIGAVGQMKPQPPGSPTAYQRSAPAGAYARFWGEREWPCQQPPWGTLNAVDLNRGTIAWKVPLGVVDELAAKGVPPTGAPNLGGAIATAGGLVFIAGSNDRRFRAFDADTGRELWTTRLEASGHATPITYQGPRSGRQYVVIAAGGGGSFSKTGADVLAAYALPE
jgi:quinoprotein glucose dehydrogenase